MDDEEKVKMANELYETLQSEGIGTILDDRKNLNIGAKMKDCKILGTPYMIVLGDKTEGNQLELENIKTGEKETVTIDKLIERFK
jgi:prolyl-tRNA synthetase